MLAKAYGMMIDEFALEVHGWEAARKGRRAVAELFPRWSSTALSRWATTWGSSAKTCGCRPGFTRARLPGLGGEAAGGRA